MSLDPIFKRQGFFRPDQTATPSDHPLAHRSKFSPPQPNQNIPNNPNINFGLSLNGFNNVAPPGMEHVVKALKKEKGVSNPFALAWWLKKRK